MAAATEGRYTTGAKKGWRWQVFADPASPTGYTRKEWNPTDSSNEGKPTEYFGYHDYAADQEDAAAAASKADADAKNTSQRRAALAADKNAEAKQRESELDRQYGNYAAERTSREGVASADRGERLQEIRLRLAEDKRYHDQQFGLDQARLGADILKTGASLRGPDDLVQGWAYAQGVTNSGLSPYVQAIQQGTATAYGGGQARQGNPAPLTVGSLAASMGAGGGGGGTGGGGTSNQYGTDAYGRPLLAPDKQAFVDSVGKTVQNGVSNLPLGYFENMTDGQRKGFFSAAAYNGADPDAEQAYYKRSRPGQGSGLAG